MNQAPQTHTAGAIDWAARARDLAPMIAAQSDRIEREREVPAEVIAALHGAGMFRMCLPESLDGGAVTPMAFVDVLEIIAAADASTAWCLGQALGCSLAAGFVDAEVAREVFGPRDAVLAWGPNNRTARAVPVDGGYRVTGDWRFASGSRHATWIGAHADVYEADGSPRPGGGGRPELRTFLLPRSRATFTDVWNVIGLRGTGSDNYSLDDVFVPDAYSFRRNHPDDRRDPAPLYSIPQLTFYGMAFSGVALGIARATLDEIIRLGAEKMVFHANTMLRDSAVVQSQIAQAEGKLGASRAYLEATIGVFWRALAAGEDCPIDDRARLRIAITHALNQTREVVDYAYQAAGTNAIFEDNAFERRFRDMHTVAQQGQAHMVNFETAGRVLLGLDAAGPRL